LISFVLVTANGVDLANLSRISNPCGPLSKKKKVFNGGFTTLSFSLSEFRTLVALFAVLSAHDSHSPYD